MKNKTGIFHWFGYVLSIDERLELIKKCGFDKVMLWWEDEDYPYITKRQDIAKKAIEYDLEIDSVHLPSINNNALWSDDSSIRNKYIDTMLSWIYECKQSGIDKLVTHVTDMEGLSFNMSNGYKSFEKIINFADNIDMKIAAENTRMNKYLEFILDEFDTKHLGLCYDSSHDFITDQSKGEILTKYKNRLFCVHISDNDFNLDRHWLPGNGIIDYNEIVNIIKASSCDCFSMEVFPTEEEKVLTPEQFLLKANKYIKNIIK